MLRIYESFAGAVGCMAMLCLLVACSQDSERPAPAPPSEDAGTAEQDVEAPPLPPATDSPWRFIGLPGRSVSGVAYVPPDPADEEPASVVWAATRRDGLHRVTLSGDPVYEQIPTPGLALADVLVEGSQVTVLLEDGGVYHSVDGGESWSARNVGYEAPPDQALVPEGARPVGRRLMAAHGELYLLATGGGLYRWLGDEERWQNLFASSEIRNPAFEAAWVLADGTLVVGFADIGLLVPSASRQVTGTLVYRSQDDGSSWQAMDEGLEARHVTSLVEAAGVLYAGTNGDGVFRFDEAAEEWLKMGLLPDPHVMGLHEPPGGGLLAFGASSYVMLSQDGGESFREVTGPLNEYPPVTSAAFRADKDGDLVVGLAGDGLYRNEYTLRGPPPLRPAPAIIQDGVVHLAFSFEVTFAHPDRGGSPDEDGFGDDLRVLRGVLEMLDRHPEVRADWVFENAVTLDELLPTHGPELVDWIRQRLGRPDGTQDSLRLSAWNHGIVGAETEEEIVESILRARESYRRAFGASFAPGVHPPGNMFSPDHARIYQREDLGIQWVSLPYSASHVTGFSQDASLTLEQRYNLLKLQSDSDSGLSLLLVPLYQPEDVMGHGGLRRWVEKVRRQLPNKDTLIALHVNVRSDVALGLEPELEAVEALIEELKAGESGRSYVQWTTLQDYFYRHRARPEGEVSITRDLASGAFGGYQGWSEKWSSRELWTPIERARIQTDTAAELLYYAPRAAREAVRNDSIEPAFVSRLLALSSAHFGAGDPSLHPDRESLARSAADQAQQLSQAAVAASVALIRGDARPSGDVWLFNPSSEAWSGVARVPVAFEPGERDPVSFTASSHWIEGSGDNATRRSEQQPGQLVRWTTHPEDDSLATGEFWVNLSMEGRQLLGLSFSSPRRAPEFGGNLQSSPSQLRSEFVDLRLDESGTPFSLLIEHADREFVPLAQPEDWGRWWQPWITWEGQRYEPESYVVSRRNVGARGYTADLTLEGSVEVPGGGLWTVRYTFRVVKDQRLLFLEVETSYPGDAEAGADLRLTEAVPVGLMPWFPAMDMWDHDDDDETPLVPDRQWLERQVVWRETYRGDVGGFYIQRPTGSVNSSAAMGWAASFSTLVAFDRWERSSPAFMPVRFLAGQGRDLRVLLAPFGSLDGDLPDPRPERLGATSVGAQLSRLSPRLGPAAPTLAGRTERFSLALGAVPAAVGKVLRTVSPTAATIRAARHFASRPVVIQIPDGP